MLSTDAQVQFAAEFLSMLVAASGFALVALRRDPARSGLASPSLGAGFLVAGTVAFVRGSMLVTGHAGLLAGLRLAGVVLLLAGSGGWVAGRRALQAGACGIAVAAAVEAAGGTGLAVDAVLAAANLVLAAAVLAAARRSIAARVAANTAATLLLVVLVLSVALSTVITDAVEHDQLVSLGVLARVDGQQVAARTTTALQAATSLTAAMDEHFPVPAGGGSGVGAAGRRGIAQELATLQPAYAGLSVGYLPASGPPVGASRSLAVIGAAAKAPAVRAAGCSPAGGVARSVTTVAGGRLVAVAADPVCSASGTVRYGAIVVVDPVGAGLLHRLTAGEAGIGVTLVSAGHVLGASGPQPPAGVLAAGAGDPAPELTGGRLLAAEPISSAGGSVVVLVATSTLTHLDATRSSLLRTLFVIALGGTILAFGLAVATGDRITSGVRRLTGVAQLIRAGGTSERAGPVSDDEVGALAGAFDAMVASVEEKTVELRDAADDETRLRNRLEAVVAGMGDALVAVDAAGVVTDFNRAAEELTGLPATSAVGRDVRDVVTLSGGAAGAVGDRLAAPDPSPAAALADLRRAGGALVPVALSVGAVRGPLGELAGSVLVMRDLRREQEVERMKTEFLSRVGHELRTPLTGILGYADILMRRDVPAAKARAWHGEIVAAAKRQLRIISLLEFFASAGAGRMTMRREPLDVAGLAAGVVGAWSERVADDRPLRLRVAGDPPAVRGDQRWLALAVDELVDNAVKFSPPASPVAVVVSCRGTAGVDISVSDRGRGMTGEEQAGVFGEFVQGDSSDTRGFGGLGLGLALVQRVAEGHGGSVACRSRVGRGTRVTIRLPAG